MMPEAKRAVDELRHAGFLRGGAGPNSEDRLKCAAIIEKAYAGLSVDLVELRRWCFEVECPYCGARKYQPHPTCDGPGRDHDMPRCRERRWHELFAAALKGRCALGSPSGAPTFGPKSAASQAADDADAAIALLERRAEEQGWGGGHTSCCDAARKAVEAAQGDIA